MDQAAAPEDIQLFIRLDGLGAVMTLAFVVVANGVFLRIAAAWSLVGALLLLLVALAAAERCLRAGQVLQSLALIASGNWLMAIFVPLLLPFMWPVMILTVMMPLVLASPHLSRRLVVPAVAVAAALTGVVAAIGLINDDGGVIADVEDSVELVVVIGGLAAHIVPIGLTVWQHNQLQRSNVGSLQLLNADLTTSQAALAASRNRVVQAADTERRRIERDLHDGAQQRLVALGVRLRLLQSQVDDDPETLQSFTTLIEELDGAIEEVRELAHGIYPPLLQIRGLPDALSAVARRSALPVEVDAEPIPRLPEPVETALYFTALEGLANATKHAGDDSAISLTLRQQGADFVLQVTDDGVGFDVEHAPESHGFNNLRDRLAVVGGYLQVESTPGSGTTVRATVPLRS